jgi:hypothetical protein
MRRQLHRDVRTLPGLRGRRNRSEAVATSGWKPLEASICDGGPGGRRDGRRVDRAAASPRPRPRAAVQLPAERAATLEGLAAVEQVLEHSTRSGARRGLRRGRDRNRARRRATRVPRTLDNDHRRCAPAGHPGAHPPRPASPPPSTTSRRARAAPSTRPGRKPLSTTTSDSGPANSSDHRRCAPSGRRTSSATSVAAPADDFETRAPGAVDSAAHRGRP